MTNKTVRAKHAKARLPKAQYDHSLKTWEAFLILGLILLFIYQNLK